MYGIKNIEKAQVLTLKSEVAYQPGQVVSKTLAQNNALSVTLFAFDKGEEISTHESGGDAFDTFCQGCLRTFFAVIQNQTLDFVAHGFFARFTEMDFDAIGGLSDFLYHYRWRGFLYSQRGSGCGGAAVAGVVVHRLSFP